jgi:hypothetical protein
MDAIRTNVIIDLKRVASAAQCGELVGDLEKLRGVSRAWPSPRTARMVLVDYDAGATDARHILGAVVAHAFDARIVGI